MAGKDTSKSFHLGGHGVEEVMLDMYRKAKSAEIRTLVKKLEEPRETFSLSES